MVLKNWCLFLLLLIAGSALAESAAMTREQCTREFAPRSGQAGKDVIWVPTLDEVVSAMLRAAHVGPKDLVFDLGSGDGKIPIAAAKQFGARAVGIEYNRKLVDLAQCYVRADGLTDKVEIMRADIFETDFSQATVVTLYLLPELNEKLRPTLLRMRPGTRVVSNTFKMGDWNPDQLIESAIGNTHAYLWIVPALVEGTWELRDDLGTERFRIKLAQQYQHIRNDAPGQTALREVREGKLRGDRIELSVAKDAHTLRLQGTVIDDTMQLTSIDDGTARGYTARRMR